MTPTQPRAGEPVTFTNISSGGDEWLWRFGDAAVSSSRSTTHTYREPGTYLVTLQADKDKKKNRIATHNITIFDTVPTFVSNYDNKDIFIFNDLTFTAQCYNPNYYNQKYIWSIEGVEYEVVDSIGSAYKVYFTTPGTAKVKMHLEQHGQSWDTTRVYEVKDRQGQALLMFDSNQTYLRQRLFYNFLGREIQERAEVVSALTYPEGKQLLDEVQDTIQTYNGRTFKLSELKEILPSMIGFRLGRNKVYFRTTDGFYVSNLDGRYVQPICGEPVYALAIDDMTGAERVYWATATAVYFMPLVAQNDNKFDIDKVELINLQPEVIRLAVDTTLRY